MPPLAETFLQRHDHVITAALKYTGSREPDRSWRAPSNAATAPSHAPTNGPANERYQTSCAANGALGSPPSSHRNRQ